MAEIPVKIMMVLNSFIDNLEKSNISLKKAILFGSYAKNSANSDSDIDVALVSSDFTGNILIDNDLIRKSKLTASYDIEAHTFTEEEFNLSNPFVKEILRSGISII